MEQAGRLLSNVKVQGQIQKLMDQSYQQAAITAEYVLNGIRAVTDGMKTTSCHHRPFFFTRTIRFWSHFSRT